MGHLTYRAVRGVCSIIHASCIRATVLHAERVPSAGPALLAVTHLGNLEPPLLSVLIRRPIRWMARREFYQFPPRAWLLDRCGAFCVDRTGFALPTIRRALEHLARAELVGLFPEGGVACGPDSVLNGGHIKQGVCTIALRAQAPIIPVVVLGAETLVGIRPWLPARRGRVWIAYGAPILPPPRSRPIKPQRIALAGKLEAAFIHTATDLRARCGLNPATNTPAAEAQTA